MDANSTRWRRRKEARPTEIIAAALESFGERGYAGTKLDDVAKRAGVTKGTLYLYFPNKEELFKAVVREALSSRLARMIVPASPLPAASQIELLVASLRELAASPAAAIPKLILSEAGNFPELVRFYADEVIGRGLKLIKSVLRRGVKSGEFRDIDIDHVCYCVVAPMLLGVLWKQNLEPHTGRKLDLRALSRAHLDILFNGLRQKESSS